MAKMTLIKKGAEAELYKGTWQGFDVIYKRRIKKPYRNSDLDSYIRTSRTSLEAKLLSESRRLHVPTPVVYLIDIQNTEIIMSYIPGVPLKKMIIGMDEDSIKRFFTTIGDRVGRLHRGGIVHGDLTTSNMIVKDGNVFFIDFGLGEHTLDLEARGVDIHLMRRTLESSHHEVSKIAYNSFITGYSKAMGGKTKEVLRRVSEIRRRGRYIEGERL
ncbi:MAG: Kae1-associated serine/threonine protein kinase [Candidatus Methanomethyliaceae archaeon]|nr:Kae1-associated serine/threonine protein kinase [Candidatus Methanomethyliaceae archaeon]